MGSFGVAARSEAPRAALHELSTALARSPGVVEFARSLVRGYGRGDRLARIAAVFTFVAHLVDVPPAESGELRDGVDLMTRLAGEDEGPAVILSAILRALGERASVDCAPGMAFVRVELTLDDLARLPPHAGLFVTHGRYYLPLDARQARSPLGFLPLPVRRALRASALAV